jgi:uncharacterized protein YjfI (DUF2170 family)
MAAASGTISDDKLNLDMVSLEKVSLYRIAMTVSEDLVTGSYTALMIGLLILMNAYGQGPIYLKSSSLQMIGLCQTRIMRIQELPLIQTSTHIT